MDVAIIEEARLSFPTGSGFPIQRISPSPCSLACPAGVNVKAYVSLIAEGRYSEALQVVRMSCPLPAVCGRVCNHPCESVCIRNSIDQPVSIRALKRFISESETKLPDMFRLSEPYRKEKIAVVGSGPSGLVCAHDLARQGFRVTLLESENDLGGMLRWGIPDYRLPPEILDREIEFLLGPGIEVRTGVALGRDIGLEDLKGEGHSAVYVAVGASKSRRLGLAGEGEFQGIHGALNFLKRVNEGDRSPIGERVLVIGGGSSAIDAARTSLRLGAKSADIVYRRSKEEMPAVEEEVRDAEAEGVNFRWLAAPEELKVKNWRIVGLGCLEVRLGEPDASGRRRPIPVSGSDFLLPADTIISSIGQEAWLPFFGSEHANALDKSGYIIADPETCTTRIPGIFSGGDVVTGPATVIEAIASGHKAARSIAAFIDRGSEALEELTRPQEERWELGFADAAVDRVDRTHAPELNLEERGGFDEVELCFSEKEAREEASRCQRCGPCSECWSCVPGCPRRHVLVRGITIPGEKGEEPIDLLLRSPREGMPAAARLEEEAAGRLKVIDFESDEGPVLPVTVSLVKSVVDPSLCRGCGECVEICAFDAPHLVPGTGGEMISRIDPTECRGCGLCVSVCRTGAAEIAPFSKKWIVEGRNEGRPARVVIITCERRGGCMTPRPDAGENEVDIIRLSCVGQIEAGTILSLILRGTERVIVAGCATDRCRFESGAGIAHEQIRLARRVLSLSGVDPGRVQSDWSETREGDALPWKELVVMGGES